jgi:hypothetical protein
MIDNSYHKEKQKTIECKALHYENHVNMSKNRVFVGRNSTFFHRAFILVMVSS